MSIIPNNVKVLGEAILEFESKTSLNSKVWYGSIELGSCGLKWDVNYYGGFLNYLWVLSSHLI